MGKKDNLIPFDISIIKNKELILNMLKHEDELFLSEEGQNFLNEYGNNITSLEGSKSIQRQILNNFGFESQDSDLKNYRSIFDNYYNSSKDYDADILNSVYYMRENRCLYYKSEPLKINQEIPNVDVYGLDGETINDLHLVIKSKKYDKTILAAFSLS
jgi:hypothetical protein